MTQEQKYQAAVFAFNLATAAYNANPTPDTLAAFDKAATELGVVVNDYLASFGAVS